MGMPETEMTPDMEACMKAGLVGEHHAALSAFEGTWSAVVKLWFQPGTDPHESTGTMTSSRILDGRFIEHDFVGDDPEMPFAGKGHFGYDNVTGRYQGTWLDSMSTAIMTETGTYDSATKTFEMHGTVHNPVDGKPVNKRSVIRVESDDRHVMEMYHPGPDGNEYMAMEIVYTRK